MKNIQLASILLGLPHEVVGSLVKTNRKAVTEAINNVSELNDENEPVLNVCGKTYKVLAPENFTESSQQTIRKGPAWEADMSPKQPGRNNTSDGWVLFSISQLSWNSPQGQCGRRLIKCMDLQAPPH